MIIELNHFGVVVRDFEAVATFLAGFGAEVVFDRMSATGSRIVYLRVGSGLVELIHPVETDLPDGERHLGFLSDDLDADHLRLLASGCRELAVPTTAGTGVGRTSLVATPAGARIELLQRDLDLRPRVEGQRAKCLDYAIDGAPVAIPSATLAVIAADAEQQEYPDGLAMLIGAHRDRLLLRRHGPVRLAAELHDPTASRDDEPDGDWFRVR